MTNDTHRHSDGPALILDHYPHHYRMATRSSDSRGEGHIPNAQIALYADDAREPVHRAIMGDSRLAGTLQLAEISYRFLHETTYPGSLILGVGIVAVGTSSLRQIMGVFRDDRCLVLCRYTVVKVQAGRPLALTPEERQRAEPFLVRS